MGGDNCPQPGLTQICCCISWSNVVIISFAVSVDCIKEIRSGKNTDVFREMDRDDIQEDCAFSVIYGEAFETLNLVAYTPDDANIWVTGLRCLVDSDKGNYGIVVLGGWYSHIFPMYCRDVPPVRVSVLCLEQGRHHWIPLPKLLLSTPSLPRYDHPCIVVTHFTPEIGQFQISRAAWPTILHHTVWRTWLFIAYSDYDSTSNSYSLTYTLLFNPFIPKSDQF